MFYRILADSLMVVHFLWILFMLWGFVLTVRGFWKPQFFERWLFRSVHLAGIMIVAGLELLDRYCPLTIWEHTLRKHYDSETDYTGSFIINHIENLIYPDVAPIVLVVPTVFIALFTLLVFIFRPPTRLKNIFFR